MTNLSPTQQSAYDELTTALEKANIVVIYGRSGMGKTTLLNKLQEEKNGKQLSLKNYIDELRKHDPLQMEEVLEQILTEAVLESDLVLVDDLHMIYNVVCGCGFGDAYPRGKYVEAILNSVASNVFSQPEKKLVIATERVPAPVQNRALNASIRKFDAKDFESLCSDFLGKKAANLDYSKIFRFAPKLDVHQLWSACNWLKDTKNLDTAMFIEYLRSKRMGSNVDLEEVEAVELSALRGVDEIIESLEANIIVPLERDDLATKYDIQPKRGVLLAGPPGTGKTTVGRALAHRLRSKFFLIDGTFISGSSDFYAKVLQVFEAAKSNAPSIIFIDDSDVIFENKDDFGLYRYLLTMLDGLEGESSKRICVMMTTMDVASVPSALVRSGRIELWLETKLPDEDARFKILQDHTHKLPPELRSYDSQKLAKETEGLTGADLKRLIEDTKILVAYDVSKKLAIGEPFSYFEKAVSTIRENKEKYQRAEEMAKLKQEPMSLASSIRARMGSTFFPKLGNDDDD